MTYRKAEQRFFKNFMMKVVIKDENPHIKELQISIIGKGAMKTLRHLWQAVKDVSARILGKKKKCFILPGLV